MKPFKKYRDYFKYSTSKNKKKTYVNANNKLGLEK